MSEWPCLVIFSHAYFGYVAVPDASPEDLLRRKQNGWKVNTYVPADAEPNLATRMTIGHLVEKVESLDHCRKLDDDTIQKLKGKIEKLEKAIMKGMAHAGHPDAAEGCRLVIATGKNVLEIG